MFELEDSSTTLLAALIGTHHETTPDNMAGYAVTLALALQNQLSQVSPGLLSTTITSVTHTVGDVQTTHTQIDGVGTVSLTDFEEPGKSAQEVFAKSAMDQVAATTQAHHASTAEAPESIDTPLQSVEYATAPGDTISTNMTTANVSDVPLDSEGLPWDARIHSSSKTQIKDGTWKLKRNLAASIIESVKAELRGVMAIPKIVNTATEAVSSTTTAAPSSVQGAIDTNPFSVSTVNKLIDAGNGGTAIAPPPPVAAAGKITTFPAIMKAITEAKLESEFVKSVLSQFEIPGMPILATRPDLIPLVAEALGL